MNASELFAAGVRRRYNEQAAEARRSGVVVAELTALDLELILDALRAVAAGCDALNPSWPPWWLAWIPGIGTPGLDVPALRRRADGVLDGSTRKGLADRAALVRRLRPAGRFDPDTMADAICMAVLAEPDATIRQGVEELRREAS